MTDLAELYKLVRRFEGCRLMPYYCPSGVLTCGWGSTGFDVFPGKPWTQDYADRRMEQDALRFATGVLVSCPSLSGGALCAISDWAYNCGLGALKASTLRKRINAGDWDGAKFELGRWNKAGGRILPGLALRRAAEAAMM